MTATFTFSGTARLLPLSLVFLGLAGSAAAQGPVYWDGLAHQALGSATVGTSGGGLVISNIGSMGLDGVDTRMPPPPPAGSVAPLQYHLSLGSIDVGGVLPAGASMRMTASGTVGGAPDQVLATLEMEKQLGGGVAYSPDFSGQGATTYTVEAYLGGVLVYSGGGFSGGPAFLTNCDALPPICCWLGAVTYYNGHWYALFPCPVEVQVGGSTFSTERVLLIPENVPGPDDLTGMSMHARDIPSIVYTDETTTGFGTIGTSYCTALPNSTGASSWIFAQGSDVAVSNDVSLNAAGLPVGQFGYFLASPTQGFIPHPAGSAGNFCLGTGPMLGRYRGSVQNSGGSGTFALHIDLTAVPIAVAPEFISIQAGDTWNFQAWHRDVGNTNNFTDGVQLMFF